MNLKHLIAKAQKAVAKDKKKEETLSPEIGDVVFIKPEVANELAEKAEKGEKNLYKNTRPWVAVGKGEYSPLATTNLDGQGGEKGLSGRVEVIKADGSSAINGVVKKKVHLHTNQIVVTKTKTKKL